VTVHITARSVVDELRRAVEERGADYVYPKVVYGGCMNVVKDPITGEQQAGCIVGLVFANLGITLEDQVTKAGNGTDVYEVTRSLELNGVVTYEKDLDRTGGFEDSTAIQLLRTVQSEQDGGWEWGKAVEWGFKRYRSELAELGIEVEV
jgi:hypothetical protein